MKMTKYTIALCLMVLINFAAASTAGYADASAFTLACGNASGSSGTTANSACWAVKYTGYQCCNYFSTVTFLGSSVTTSSCSIKNLSNTSGNTQTGSAGVGGLAGASITEYCSSKVLGIMISMTFAAIMMIFA